MARRPAAPQRAVAHSTTHCRLTRIPRIQPRRAGNKPGCHKAASAHVAASPASCGGSPAAMRSDAAIRSTQARRRQHAARPAPRYWLIPRSSTTQVTLSIGRPIGTRHPLARPRVTKSRPRLGGPRLKSVRRAAPARRCCSPSNTAWRPKSAARKRPRSGAVEQQTGKTPASRLTRWHARAQSAASGRAAPARHHHQGYLQQRLGAHNETIAGGCLRNHSE